MPGALTARTAHEWVVHPLQRHHSPVIFTWTFPMYDWMPLTPARTCTWSWWVGGCAIIARRALGAFGLGSNVKKKCTKKKKHWIKNVQRLNILNYQYPGLWFCIFSTFEGLGACLLLAYHRHLFIYWPSAIYSSWNPWGDRCFWCLKI